MFVQWEQVETVLRRGYMGRLCPECKERYEPCVVVWIAGGDLLHLLTPVFFSVDGPPYYAFTFCGKSLEYGMLRLVVGSGCIDDWRFWRNILRRYPELLHLPLTERVLREVGCDIEAEWALWLLGNRWG